MRVKHSSKKYVLEICQPDRQGFVTACAIESDEPFLSIQKGDILNPSTWNLYCADSLEAEHRESSFGVVLKVTGIEHALVQREDGSIRQHKITVFVIPVENNRDVLFGKSGAE